MKTKQFFLSSITHTQSTLCCEQCHESTFRAHVILYVQLF